MVHSECNLLLSLAALKNLDQVVTRLLEFDLVCQVLNNGFHNALYLAARNNNARIFYAIINKIVEPYNIIAQWQEGPEKDWALETIPRPNKRKRNL